MGLTQLIEHLIVVEPSCLVTLVLLRNQTVLQIKALETTYFPTAVILLIEAEH